MGSIFIYLLAAEGAGRGCDGGWRVGIDPAKFEIAERDFRKKGTAATSQSNLDRPGQNRPEQASQVRVINIHRDGPHSIIILIRPCLRARLGR